MMTETQMQELQENPQELAKKLNSILPTFDELAQNEMLPRIIGLGMMLPSKRERIATAVNQMTMTMMGSKFYNYYSVEENVAEVEDHMGRTYQVTMEEFEVLIKIMFTSWLEYTLKLTPEQGDLYNAFKWQANMSRILD
jgi:hypothetical protein